MASTTTPKTEAVQHLQVVEIENASGGRYWTTPMLESELSQFLAEQKITSVSDWDCAVDCPACGANS